MAAIPHSSFTTLPSVGERESANKAVIFCDDSNAESNARDISELLNDRKIFICTTSGDDLAQRIATFIGSDVQNTVTLFGHNLGTLCIQRALEKLEKTITDKITVYTLGGVEMIPNKLAARVHNYVLDVLTLSTSDPVLRERLKILNLQGGESLEQAIASRAFHDLYHALHPLNPNRISDKAQRFENIFEKNRLGELHTDPYYLESVERYRGYFNDYTITILALCPDLPGQVYAEPGTASKISEGESRLLLSGMPYSLSEDTIESYERAFRDIRQLEEEQ